MSDQVAVAKTIGDILGETAEKLVTEALLRWGKRVGLERDQEWAKALTSLYPGELSTNIEDAKSQITKWQIQNATKLKEFWFNEGLKEGFQNGVQKGAKMGWGGHEIGYTLDETLERSKDVKP